MKQQPMGPILGPWFKDMEEAPPDAHECAREVMTRVSNTRQRGRWWPLPRLGHPVSRFPGREPTPAPIPLTGGQRPARGFTMFSAVKFVVASVIVALFGGFLLAGILTTQQGDEIVPAAVTESPTPMTTDASLFPTGTFVAAEWSDRVLEFNDDGTCRYSSHDDPWHANCTYEVVGDLFTEASYEWGSPDYEHQPATYRWQFDGEYLTFELVGDDGNSWRRAFYQEQPYRYVPDPRVAVIASFDIEPGTRLLAGHTELRVVSAADIPADTLTTKDPATDAITTVAITKGQPITSDMLAQPTD